MALMLIVDAYSEHAGQYSCKAANRAGEATCTATLRVTPKGKAQLASKILICCLFSTLTVTNESLSCLSHCILSQYLITNKVTPNQPYHQGLSYGLTYVS